MLRSFTSVVALALLAGCPVLDIQVDVPQTCVTYPGLQVGASASGSAIDATVTDNQLGALQALATQGLVVTLVSGAVRAASGITDLGFVERAGITLASGSASSTLPSVDAFDCGPCGSGSAITLSPTSATDLAPYFAGGTVAVSVDLAGALPTVAWSMDVEVCVAGSGTRTYDP